MRRWLPLVPLALALALVAAPPTHAGGFATAGLSSTPDGAAPAQRWTVDITVLQHGRTPLEGVTPRVRIHSGDAAREFTATPTGEPGVYRAEVVFPRAGRWDYEVLDGFNDELPHSFPAVRIDAGAAAPAPEPPATPGGDAVAAGWLWGAGAALVLTAAVLGTDRRRRRSDGAGRAPEPA